VKYCAKIEVIAIILLIKDNIVWLKDLFSIFFSTVVIVVAILTYRRAKATVLQPIRTEVIKKQSEILVELLDFLPSDGKLIHDGLDYSSIATTNSYKHLNELGFLFANQDEILKRINNLIAGWTYVGESQTIMDVEVVGIFEEEKKEDEKEINLGKAKYEKAKEGIIEIDKVFFTIKHQEFSNKLSGFYQNPYLPREIQTILKKIIDDIGINIHVNMRSVLADFLKEFCYLYFSKKEIPKINPIGVFNNFNHKRISHKRDLKRLREEVRKYLMIDEKWK